MADRQEIAKSLIVKYHNDRAENADVQITRDDVYVVWFFKTLENWKAMLATTVPDSMYYEVTHSGNAHETYLDTYRKIENVAVLDEQL